MYTYVCMYVRRERDRERERERVGSLFWESYHLVHTLGVPCWQGPQHKNLIIEGPGKGTLMLWKLACAMPPVSIDVAWGGA